MSVQRLPVSPLTQAQMLDVLEKQLDKKIAKHGTGAYHGPHESLGIVTEEFWELVEAVKSNKREDVKAELLDVAVACLWGYASLETLDKQEGTK